MAPVHWAAGSDGETNLGATALAAPNAASSSVARYSFVTRFTACASSSLFHCEPGVDRCLLAAATIRLASTAKPSPPRIFRLGRLRLRGPPCPQARAHKTSDRPGSLAH